VTIAVAGSAGGASSITGLIVLIAGIKDMSGLMREDLIKSPAKGTEK
jgi:hypothetical protein